MAPPSSTTPEFAAFYLQRATAELAADLDQLRTAPDFFTGTGTGTGTTTKANAATPHPADNPLQMLVGALRQGAGLFSAEEQARVMSAGAGAGAAEEAGEAADAGK